MIHNGVEAVLIKKPDQEAETEPSGGILPLVFGLPFAPEISAFDFQTSPAKALVSQRVTIHSYQFNYPEKSWV